MCEVQSPLLHCEIVYSLPHIALCCISTLPTIMASLFRKVHHWLTSLLAKGRGRGGGVVDGWMDGLSIVRGGKRYQPYQQALIVFRVPIGLANWQDLGSCEREHMTPHLMVGNFSQPPPPHLVW